MQQNRQKLAPQLAQPVRVQQMLLQPQQGKKKTFHKTSKIQMTPMFGGKGVRPHITITQPTISSQSPKIRQSSVTLSQKNVGIEENSFEENANSPSKLSDACNLHQSLQSQMPSSTSPLENVSQILQNNKNISISLSEPSKNSTSSVPDPAGSLSNKLNPNFQISSVPEQLSVSEILPQKSNQYHINTSTSNLQPHLSHNAMHSTQSESKSLLTNKSELSVQPINMPQTVCDSNQSPQQKSFAALQSPSILSTGTTSQQNSDISFQPTLGQQTSVNPVNQKQLSEQSLQYNQQDHSSPRLPQHQFHMASQNPQTMPRKRKSSNKQASKKTQPQLGLMTQSHSLQTQADSSQQFHHSPIADHHLPENHFPNFSHHVPNSDFQSFSNFSPRKPHIQHPQPLHPLQHSQDPTLPPHLQHLSHLYSVPPHLAGSPITEMQPPRAWPQPPFHPFSQSSPYYSSDQESSHFSFQSSFPSVASNQSESSEDKSPRISSSDV
ncbi:myb-like protein Q [Parasteatoda tepidariorum]|uniref:myb-like protein Q n=1 Tax=Parasteatoda tepidariorum TaxID=114398 RepID=UPI0039BC8E85